MALDEKTQVAMAQLGFVVAQLAVKIYFVRKAAKVFGFSISRHQAYVIITAVQGLLQTDDDYQKTHVAAEKAISDMHHRKEHREGN